MTSTDNHYRGELADCPFWHDEGGNYVRVAPSSDGGVYVWATDYGNEAGPRLGTDEVRDMAAHLIALCDEIDRAKAGKHGLYPQEYHQVRDWNATEAAKRAH
jgi:hypothetical protein